MSYFSRLRIGQRLAMAFGASIALLVLVALVAVSSMRSIGGSLHEVTEQNYVKVRLVDRVQAALNEQARYARNVLIFDDAQQRRAELDHIATARADAAAAYEKLSPMVVSAEGRSQLAAVLADRGVYVEALAAFDRAARADDMTTARSLLLDKVRPAQLAYMASLDKFAAHEEQNMTASVRAADAVVATSLWLVVGLSAAALVLGVLASLLASRSITRPLHVAVASAERVAAGDLTASLAVSGNDETAQLLGALQRMTSGLQSIVGRVRLASDSIATGSTQIANGNADLSQRTEEQASNLQQTAASMEQLTAAVKANADTASEASLIAAEASDVALRGGEAVGMVVRTMQDITSSSQRIVEIIGVIDGIAFQTNILALNAAVEAARAGEQGRGFAVVASEVRALAQRSAGAAKEIKTLIGASAATVESGSRLVSDAGRTMDDLVTRVRRVNELIGQISSASVEQSRGISQIGDAVGQLDQVTQQNAALVEESAAAAESLRHQAQALAEAVGAFRLSAD